MRDKTLLLQLQHLPLDAKILMSQQRIREWYNYFNGDVMISFSGGKDSTVLAHLVHKMYPDVPLVFANTGLEYPEIQAFAKKMGAEFVRPKMRFDEVITKYGYPIISKEVAEAIHCARYISHKDYESLDPEHMEEESHTWTGGKRMELHGISRRYKAKKETDNPDTTLPHNEEPEQPSDESDNVGFLGIAAKPEKGKYDKHNWENWRRKSLLGVGDFNENSLFSKTKWLPLCQETQFLISHYCCNIMKKNVLKGYQKKTHRVPYLGTMAEESRLRTQKWIQHGCNAFESGKQVSAPLSFGTEQDVLHYIRQEGLEIASVYGDIVEVDDNGLQYYDNFLSDQQCTLKCTKCDRTGCVYCGFGCHIEKTPRFVRLSQTHPRQYEYCMNGGQWVDNPKYDPAAPEYDGAWKNWNPKKIWVPSKEGLGMRKVLQDVNELYGKGFIKYE